MSELTARNPSYQSWQPIETNITARGTKPPYYGNLAVAAFMHKPSPSSQLRISSLPSSSIYSTQYTAHVDNMLTRLLLVDLHTYNTTTENNYTTPGLARPIETYAFQVPNECKGEAKVQRLLANGSDAITGITWDGYSFNYELDQGKPVRMRNVTCDEKVKVGREGLVTVEVPWSSAAIVSLEC
jgi:hypothetical protein